MSGRVMVSETALKKLLADIQRVPDPVRRSELLEQYNDMLSRAEYAGTMPQGSQPN